MTRVHPSVKKRYCPFRSTNARARHGATHSPLSTFLTRRSFRAAAAVRPARAAPRASTVRYHNRTWTNRYGGGTNPNRHAVV